MNFSIDKLLEDAKADALKTKDEIREQFIAGLLEELNPKYNVKSVNVTGYGGRAIVQVQSGGVSKFIDLNGYSMKENIKLWKTM